MNKIPRINLPKEAKDRFSNYKIVMKEIKYDQTDVEIYHTLRLEDSIL